MARTAVHVGTYALQTNVHQASVVPITTLPVAAPAFPQTTTQAIVATAVGPVHRQTTTAVLTNARSVILTLDLLFALLQRTPLSEIPFAPTFHPIGKTVDPVATSVLLISAPQAVAVPNMRGPAETVAFSSTMIQAIAGLVVLSVQAVMFVRMGEVV